MKGGYQIFDLKDRVFTSGSSTIVAGARAIVNGANGKRVVVENLKVGQNVFSAFDVSFPKVASTATASAKGLAGSNTITLAVASNDGVTVTVS